MVGKKDREKNRKDRIEEPAKIPDPGDDINGDGSGGRDVNGIDNPLLHSRPFSRVRLDGASISEIMTLLPKAAEEASDITLDAKEKKATMRLLTITGGINVAQSISHRTAKVLTGLCIVSLLTPSAVRAVLNIRRFWKRKKLSVGSDPNEVAGAEGADGSRPDGTKG